MLEVSDFYSLLMKSIENNTLKEFVVQDVVRFGSVAEFENVVFAYPGKVLKASFSGLKIEDEICDIADCKIVEVNFDFSNISDVNLAIFINNNPTIQTIRLKNGIKVEIDRENLPSHENGNISASVVTAIENARSVHNSNKKTGRNI